MFNCLPIDIALHFTKDKRGVTSEFPCSSTSFVTLDRGGGVKDIGVTEIGGGDTGAVASGAIEIGVIEIGDGDTGAGASGAIEIGVTEIGDGDSGAGATGVNEIGGVTVPLEEFSS